MIVEQLKDDQVKLETEHQIYFVKENEIKIKNKIKEFLTEKEKDLINLMIKERLNSYHDTEIQLRKNLECAIDLRVYEAVNLVLKNITEERQLCIEILKKIEIE
jgi:hypothetical protein